MDSKDNFIIFTILTLGLIWALLSGYWLQYIIMVLSFALVYLYNEYLNLKQQLPKKKPVEMEKKFGRVIVSVRDVSGGYQVVFMDEEIHVEGITMTYGDFQEAVRWIDETVNLMEVTKKEIGMKKWAWDEK